MGALRHGLPFTAWVLPPAVDAVRVHALKQVKGDRAFAKLLLVAREKGLEVICPLETGPFEAGVFRYVFLTGRGAESDESEQFFGRAKGGRGSCPPATL